MIVLGQTFSGWLVVCVGGGESDFRRKFHSLLREYQPDPSLITDVLSKTYPFSIESMKDGEEHREELISHLDQLKKLDSREMSVYRKYQEVRKLNPPKRLVNKVEKNIWKPDKIANQKSTIKEIERLEPIIEFVENDLVEFNILRVKSTTMEWFNGP